MFCLRFPAEEITSRAERYSYRLSNTHLLDRRSEVSREGRLTKALLDQVAQWKSPRSAGHVQNNSDRFVEEVTAFALAARDERSRIESLTLLDGVSWPTASVILHLFHRDPYPILDFRALWSLGVEEPAVCRFPFWWEYVETCRRLSGWCCGDMQTLDRALWQYSKEHQRNSLR